MLITLVLIYFIQPASCQSAHQRRSLSLISTEDLDYTSHFQKPAVWPEVPHNWVNLGRPVSDPRCDYQSLPRRSATDTAIYQSLPRPGPNYQCLHAVGPNLQAQANGTRQANQTAVAEGLYCQAPDFNQAPNCQTLPRTGSKCPVRNGSNYQSLPRHGCTSQSRPPPRGPVSQPEAQSNYQSLPRGETLPIRDKTVPVADDIVISV